MVRKFNILTLGFTLVSAALFAQSTVKKGEKTLPKSEHKKEQTVTTPVEDPILLTVGGDPVTKSEFENIYHKNNPKDNPDDRKALEEYLELFINFKLKVKAAKALGKDTTTAFRNELKGYRSQLAKPYLSDKDVNERLIEEAYERMKKDVKASHILIKVAENALPKDTLAAYNKAISLRNRLLKGENFADLARINSDDPSAAQNGGDLGYFTSLMMVYPFESAAYSTPVGQYSMPVRTKFGYHILKVSDIREAQGQVKCAHILVKVPENANDSIVKAAKKKADEIVVKIKAGEDFGALAQNFSDDRSSGKNGGQLGWFGTGKMVPEFEKAAFDLKDNNQVSEPIRTAFGWHIIKRLERKGLQPFDELKSEIKQKITRDSRSQVSRNAVIERVKKENNFTEDPKALNELIALVDTNYRNGKWSAEKAKALQKNLFTLGDQKYSQAAFAQYIAENQTKQAKDANIEGLVRKAYEGYKTDKIILFEDERLEQKYPEFKLLMQEYRDGILLFEITDEQVWSKAIRDSAGLTAFHNQNMGKYMWPQRAEATVYQMKDAKIAKQTRKLVAKKAKKNYSLDDIKKLVNKSSQLNLQTESGLFVKGDNETVDAYPWVKGITADAPRNDGSIVFVDFEAVREPEPKTLSEARGLITADYQNYLEQLWIKDLKAKYSVEVNKEVFKTVK